MLKRKIKYLLPLLFLMLNFHAEAQNYLSPYSKFGLGEVMPSSFAAQRALGDASIAFSDENLISATNPASYSMINSFIFETAVNFNFYDISSSTDKFANKDYRLPYFAFAFPLAQKIGWAFSFGLRQESKVGYLFQQRYDPPNSPLGYNEIYEATGGYSKFYMGSSIRVFKNFYVGANVGYFFGTQTVNQRIDFDSLTPVSNHRDVYSNVGGFQFDLGFQYKIKLGAKNEISIGGTATLPAVINSYQDVYYNTFTTIDGTNYISDSIYKTLHSPGKATLPADYGFGIQWKNEKWLVAADFHRQTWSDFRFFDRNDSLHDLTSIGVGIQYSPGGKDLLYASFFQRIKYRIGFRYANTYYNLNNNQPSDMRLTFGFGLPIIKTSSAVDVAFELGQIGTVNSNTIQQRYYGITVGFHLFDPGWFKRRKID